MATVSFKNLHTGFAIETLIWPPYATYYHHTTEWQWSAIATGGPIVGVSGTDFQYTGDAPSSGTISSIGIDVDGLTDGKPDILVTGLGAGFGRLGYTGTDNDLGTSLLYAVMFDGDDSIDFGTNATKESFNISFSGDGTWATTFGGDDKIRGDLGTGGQLSGDLTIVKFDYTRYGGDDDIRLSASSDATVVGDAYYVAGSATLVAGDDYISIAKKGSVYGDANESVGNVRGGDDTLIGSSQADRLIGDVGTNRENTTLRGGDDSIKGGSGSDKIYGDVVSNYSSVFKGGHDRLYGDAGNDTIFGNAGNDSVWGGADSDELYGDEGNDWLSGGTGKDTMYGGDGLDTVDYGDKSTKVSITYGQFFGSMVNVKVDGTTEDVISAVENVNGGAAGDSINGSTVAMANRFDGRGGDDTLAGGTGNDTLIGGAGKDRLTGGANSDQFRFTVKPSSTNIDTITDFRHGSDRIALDDAIFAALGTSVTADEFGAKTSGHAASDKQHIIYDKSNGTLWYDADDNGSGAAVQIAKLGSIADHPTNLTYSDFLIV